MIPEIEESEEEYKPQKKVKKQLDSEKILSKSPLNETSKELSCAEVIPEAPDSKPQIELFKTGPESLRTASFGELQTCASKVLNSASIPGYSNFGGLGIDLMTQGFSQSREYSGRRCVFGNAVASEDYDEQQSLDLYVNAGYPGFQL